MSCNKKNSETNSIYRFLCAYVKGKTQMFFANDDDFVSRKKCEVTFKCILFQLYKIKTVKWDPN